MLLNAGLLDSASVLAELQELASAAIADTGPVLRVEEFCSSAAAGKANAKPINTAKVLTVVAFLIFSLLFFESPGPKTPFWNWPRRTKLALHFQ